MFIVIFDENVIGPDSVTFAISLSDDRVVSFGK